VEKAVEVNLICRFADACRWADRERGREVKWGMEENQGSKEGEMAGKKRTRMQGLGLDATQLEEVDHRHIW